MAVVLQSQREAEWETRVPDSSNRLTAHAEFAKRGLVTIKACQNKVNTTAKILVRLLAYCYCQ